MVVSCFPDGARQLAIFDEVFADREVTLESISSGGDAVQVQKTFLAPLPSKAIGDSGMIDLEAAGTSLDDLEVWADREPLPGAVMESGRRYTFFALTAMRPDRTLDDLELAWDDGTTTGTSSYDFDGRTRSGGC